MRRSFVSISFGSKEGTQSASGPFQNFKVMLNKVVERL